MEDMSQETEEIQNKGLFPENCVTALSDLLRDHKGQDVCVLDLRKFNTWTDYFIIATVTSITHMDGLERHLKEYCRDNEIEIFGTSRKNPGDEWRLIDLGSIIIHLMTQSLREFYELERLWKTTS
ncbi:MAG: ribosome silencing factor [Treponema sp.]|nr:ribosome silencing factor [Treponema sp.]